MKVFIVSLIDIAIMSVIILIVYGFINYSIKSLLKKETLNDTYEFLVFLLVDFIGVGIILSVYQFYIKKFIPFIYENSWFSSW